MSYQQVASKMKKTFVIQKNKKISPYLPETYWHTSDNVKKILDKHTCAFLKPDVGGGGSGAIKIIKQSHNKLLCKTLKTSETIHSSQLISWLSKRKLSTRRYIVQQGIDLAQVNGKPFDIRIYLQKPSSNWVISGVGVKVAPPGRIVTNLCKGSKPESLDTVISQICPDPSRASKLKNDLYKLSYDISKTLNNQFKGLRELGIDIGLDKKLGIWVFEVNTKPLHNMFKQLHNGNMYRTIIRNKKIIFSK